MKIIFAGSGEFGVPTLKRLVEAGHEIVAVVTQPDRPAGRGKKLTPTPIAGFAQTSSLSPLKTADINKEQLPPADVMVVIAFGQKIAPHIVDHPRLGSVNLHASLLPKYRGAAPINWAIIRGETVTGNSVIRLAQRMDAGPILGQTQLSIGELETAGELHDRLAQDGAPLMEQVLSDLANGSANEQPQDESLATVAPKLNRVATQINWSDDVSRITNQIRGMYPWPGCRVRLVLESGEESDRVTLVRAANPLPNAGIGLKGTARGTVLDNGCVLAGEIMLEVIELQPEGKRAMSLEAYRNGHRWEAGMRLESVL
jgi:methionyl-tRNA formyltransferase